MAIVGRIDNGVTARLAAIRALEALADERALDVALQAAVDADAGVAAAAVALAQVFLKGRRDPAILDRLTAIALDRARPESVRLAAISAVSDLKAATLKPLWETLAADPSAAIRERIGGSGRPASRRAEAPPGDQLREAAEAGLPDQPETVRRLLVAAGTTAPLPTLHRIIERLREREAAAPAAARGEWTRARGTAHIALAKRSQPGRPIRPARSARSRINAPACRISGRAFDCGRCIVPGSDCRRARARRGHVVAPASR